MGKEANVAGVIKKLQLTGSSLPQSNYFLISEHKKQRKCGDK